MTRINLVRPQLLVRQHLVAEYRELPRIFYLVKNCVARGETPEQAGTLSPERYTLGKGHCRFFYMRLAWLHGRFLLLVQEMRARGYNPTFTELPDWALDLHDDWFGPWEPTPVCVQINVERINTRLCGMGLPWMQLGLVDGEYRPLGHEGDCNGARVGVEQSG